MECNCGGYYPVSTCPVCMPSKFYKDHAEELAKALEEIASLGFSGEGAILAAEDAVEIARDALTNYREATK